MEKKVFHLYLDKPVEFIEEEVEYVRQQKEFEKLQKMKVLRRQFTYTDELEQNEKNSDYCHYEDHVNLR